MSPCRDDITSSDRARLWLQPGRLPAHAVRHAIPTNRRSASTSPANSVGRAEMLKGHRPVDYKVAATPRPPSAAPSTIAFSHEVIYLLPNLAAHAKRHERGAAAGRRLCRRRWVATPTRPSGRRWRKLIAETLVDPALRSFSGGGREGLRRRRLHRLRPSAGARCLHAR